MNNKDRKRCLGCHRTMAKDKFYKNPNVSDGYLNYCKKCIFIKRIKYRVANKDKVFVQNKRYRQKNKDKIRERDEKYSQTSSGKRTHKLARQRWAQNNPKKNIESKRKWKRNNKDKVKEYYIKNKDNIIQRQLKKRRKCPRLRLKHNISSVIQNRLKKRLSDKGGKSIFNFLPYTLEQLIQHLESQFKSGMSWQNYGFYGWHIDHKIPDCAFNYKSVEDKEFQRCWSLDNLQPLWAEENLKKNKYIVK